MKKITLALFSLLFSGTLAFAQNKNDLLYTSEGIKEVKVKELDGSEIKFTYPDEETVYSLNKFLVKKIQFSSGREEIIENPFKSVNGLTDAENIYVTYNPVEVTGLFNLGELFSKATGVTSFSSMSKVKNRSLDKMKAEASMIGANVVLIADAKSRGNYYGNENTPSQSTQTVLFGQAYSSRLLEIQAIKTELEGDHVVYYQKHTLNRNDFSPEIRSTLQYDDNRNPIFYQITSIKERDGKLFVDIPKLKTKTGILEVIRLNDGTLTVMERHKNSIYNYILMTESSELVKVAQRNAAGRLGGF